MKLCLRFFAALLSINFIVLNSSASFVDAEIKEPIKKSEQVVCISMPKCGTYLLKKCLLLMQGLVLTPDALIDQKLIYPSPAAWAVYDSLNIYDPPNHFRGRLDPLSNELFFDFFKQLIEKKHASGIWSSHSPYTRAVAEYLEQRSSTNFFVIRDPRAMLVSMAFMVSKGWLAGQEADPVLIMNDFIDGRQKNFIRWGVTVHEAYPLIWEYGIVGFYKMYLSWMQAKNFYTVRFENLVGSQGGGSDSLQKAEIMTIASHIGYALTDEKLTHVAKNLFGGSVTFRDGKIDGWKKYFSADMKAAFKQVPGANQLLIDLGYESTTDW